MQVDETKDLGMGSWSGLSERPSEITRPLYEGVRSDRAGRGDMVMDPEIRRCPPWVKGAAMSGGPRTAQSLGPGKARDTDSPWKLPEGMQPYQHLDFRPLTSRTVRINVCHFKPLSLWNCYSNQKLIHCLINICSKD